MSLSRFAVPVVALFLGGCPAPATTHYTSTDAGTDGATETGTDAGPVATGLTAADCDPGLQIFVPGGSFQMGQADLTAVNAGVVHKVTVSGFCMDKQHVTVEQFAQCDDPACVAAHPSADNGADGYNAGVTGRENWPVNGVTWVGAQVFCKSRAAARTDVVGRLPTEAEWEYAARYDDGRTYPWGEDLPAEQLCWSGNGVALTSSCAPGHVSGKNKLGILELEGNLSHWVGDWYDVYSASDQVDPTGPSGPVTDSTLAWAQRRVVRGCGWKASDPSNPKAAMRAFKGPTTYNNLVGFRCVFAKK